MFFSSVEKKISYFCEKIFWHLFLKNRLMAHFDSDFLTFFRELSIYNNRDWFQKNKPGYELHVKIPFQQFMEELLERVHQIDARINLNIKESIYRIYRDIRFSKDKTPYKTYAAALIAPLGRKDMYNPGFYIEVSGDYCRFYTGLYMVRPESLRKIRQSIVDNPKRFESIITRKEFVEKYGEVLGDKHKRLAKEFKAAAEVQPLLFNKTFYVMAELPPEVVLRDDFLDLVIDYYQLARPFNDFFSMIMNG